MQRIEEQGPRSQVVGSGSDSTLAADRGNGGWLWLALAAALLLFANGRHVMGVAAWLAPVFLVRFIRTRRARTGLAVTYLVLVAAWAFQFRGMAPLPPLGFVILAAGFGIVGLLPLLVDRLVAPRVHGFAATFVLPAAWATADFAVARLSPYGSWGSPAYSQYENLPLVQLVSVTGLYGLTFLLGWFAAVANWAWEREFEWPVIRRGILAFSLVLGAVVMGGEARLRLFPPSGPTVRAASLSAPELELFPCQDVARRLRLGGTLTAGEIEAVRERSRAINDDLLERSRREARAGARVISWAESDGFAFTDDEPTLLARGGALARAEGVYLGMAYAAWRTAAPRPLENTLALIGPGGEIVWRFVKAIPVPGREAGISARGDGKLQAAATPYGRLSGVICFDMDFPQLLAQAGDLDVDLLLVPSGDWREIDPFHAHMARFRAIEQGFNVLRQAERGLSVAADYEGRVLASTDHYTNSGHTLVAQIPTRGSRTVYSRVGDTFALFCAAGLLALVLPALLRERR